MDGGDVTFDVGSANAFSDVVTAGDWEINELSSSSGGILSITASFSSAIELDYVDGEGIGPHDISGSIVDAGSCASLGLMDALETYIALTE
jgi:hypothetical protein